MTRGRTITRLVVAALTAVTVLGCSQQAPVAPKVDIDSRDSVDTAGVAAATTGSPLALSAPGVYDLGFFVNGSGGFTPVTSLPALSNELIPGAHVTSAERFTWVPAVEPARWGTVRGSSNGRARFQAQ